MEPKPEPRWWFVAYSMGLGLVVAIAAAAGGRTAMAVMAIPIMLLAGVAMAASPTGRLRSSSMDPATRARSERASRFSGQVLLVVVLVAWLVELARGEDGRPWFLLAALGGVSYTVALVALERRDKRGSTTAPAVDPYVNNT